MKMCSFPDCPNQASPKAAKGLCNSHYWQMHKGRELTPLSYRRNVTEPWLLAHVDHDGQECLIWPFARLVTDGRAAVKWRGKQMLAAPVMCELAHGTAPTPEHETAHSCGNGEGGCVNPKHLRWATHAENEADKEIHGTHGRKPRISRETVEAIREFSHTVSIEGISGLFGLSRSHVSRIISKQSWGGVPSA